MHTQTSLPLADIHLLGVNFFPLYSDMQLGYVREKSKHWLMKDLILQLTLHFALSAPKQLVTHCIQTV